MGTLDAGSGLISPPGTKYKAYCQAQGLGTQVKVTVKTQVKSS